MAALGPPNDPLRGIGAWGEVKITNRTLPLRDLLGDALT